MIINYHLIKVDSGGFSYDHNDGDIQFRNSICTVGLSEESLKKQLSVVFGSAIKTFVRYTSGIPQVLNGESIQRVIDQLDK